MHIAQALAFIGAKPVWDPSSLRLSGYEIVPLAKLGRPRVDVTLRISGLFRDAFPQQIALFDSMPQDAQLSFLDETVEALPKAKTTLDEMVAEWIEGDADQLAALMNAELTDPVLRDRLLTSRNANWAGWIENRLAQPGTVFIAVGAGHLAGVGSVQDQLRKRGVKVRRVWQ